MGRDSSGSEGGPAAARASSALGLPKLLEGYELYLAGERWLTESAAQSWTVGRAGAGATVRLRPALQLCGALVAACCTSEFSLAYQHLKCRLPRLAGDFANRADVAALLKAAGGRELRRPPPGPAAPGGPCTSFILVEGSSAGSPAAAGGGAAAAAAAAGARAEERRWRDKAAAAGVPLVSHRWLLDSVSSYTAKPLAPYRMDEGDSEEGAP